ncbi:zinc-binding dehydrogenase [Phytohabitans flavus]|uniref:zinc-binding dehydrogenase n=1 Tax=Phytohabitans flavus TaxID=1076124 RepID=UPI003643981B
MNVADAALIEPLSCAVRGFDVLPRRLADHYLIYGAGTMGLMMMELAKRAGAASVSMVDINPTRLETARLLGCTAAVTTADELTAPRGWDVVVDCTGVEAAITDGLARVGKGGTFLQFGVASYGARAVIEPYKIYNQEITITGSMAVLHSFDRAGELWAAAYSPPTSSSATGTPGRLRQGDDPVPRGRRTQNPDRALTFEGAVQDEDLSYRDVRGGPDRCSRSLTLRGPTAAPAASPCAVHNPGRPAGSAAITQSGIARRPRAAGQRAASEPSRLRPPTASRPGRRAAPSRMMPPGLSTLWNLRGWVSWAARCGGRDDLVSLIGALGSE